MRLSFDLVDRPFIPAQTRTGHPTRLSIREALCGADNYLTIQHPSPLVTIALHRLLLAILQRTFGFGSLSTQSEWWGEREFPKATLDTYLNRWRSRFDLFDVDHPFLQVPDFGAESSRRPWTALVAELASGNNKLLFDHSLDDAPQSLDPATAAQRLIAAQCCALGGGRSAFQYTAHAPSATAAMILVQGETLFETLLLNLIPQGKKEHAADIAMWEREQPLRVADLQPGRREGFRGPAQLYVFPTRAVRLHQEQQDGEADIRWVAIASGVSLDDPLGTMIDPMVSYRDDSKRGRLSLGLNPSRAFWRDFQALRPFRGSRAEDWRAPETVNHAIALLDELDMVRPVAVMVCAQASDKAKVELWRAERFAMPTALLHDGDAWATVSDALAAAEATGKVLNDACFKLACYLLAPDKGQADSKRAGSLKNGFPMLPAFWTRLDREFLVWLSQFRALGDSDQRKRDWLQRLDNALARAWTLANGVVSRDYRGDKAIIETESAIHRQRAQLRQKIQSLQPEEETTP